MLRNLSLRFDPVEDRVVLRLVTADAEHHLHLTRRACLNWRQDLQALVDVSAQAPARLDAAARAHLSAAHHQAMATQTVLKREPVRPQDEAPPPQLVEGIACGRRRSDGRWVVRFDVRGGSPLTLVLSNETLHGLVDAVNVQVEKAGWGLPPMPVQVHKTTTADPGALH